MIAMFASRALAAAAGAAALTMMLTAPPVAAQEKIRLTVGTQASPGMSIGSVMTNVLKPGLEKHSNGRIEVVLHDKGALCSEQGCVEQMKLGQIDIATVSSGNVGAFGTTFDIINLPYLFQDNASANRILNDWLMRELAARAEKEMKVHTIAIIPVGGFRNLTNTQREVRQPSDLKGLKIRVTKSPTEFNLVRAWGAVPVPYDWAQLYEGLQSGVVQGMYLQDTFTSQGKFTEVVKHVTTVEAAYSAHPILMDLERWRKLPAWAQEAITKTGADMMREAYGYDVKWQQDAAKAMQGRVRNYVPNETERAAWHKGAKDAWVAVRGTYDPALARRILQEQNQTGLIDDLTKAKAL
ncbi:MAG: TRAP transporter substrate-binding protein [Lautropia sp.]